MRVAIASLIAIGAIAGLAVHWPPRPTIVPAISTVAQWKTISDGATTTQQVQQTARAKPFHPKEIDETWRLARDIERALLSSDPHERERALTESLPALIAADAPAAMALVERAEPGPARDELRARVAWVWSAADPGAAIDWARSVEDPNERKLVASDVAAQLATADPAAAIEVAALFNIGLDNGVIEHVTQLWAEQQPNDALEFAQAQPPGPVRDRLLARIALVQARQDPNRR